MEQILIPEEDEDDPTECECGIDCAHCDEPIEPNDAVVLVVCCVGQHFQGEDQYYVCLDDEGDYKYTPMFMHENCWMGVEDEVRTLESDVPPTRHDGEFTRCEICGSTILPWEEFASVTTGEMHISSCMPRNQAEPSFQPLQPPRPYCFGCMAHVDELIEDIEEDDEEDDEDNEGAN